jgi:hypothetical protein
MAELQVLIRSVIQLPQNSIGFCFGVFACIIKTDAVLQQQERLKERKKIVRKKGSKAE